jgi:hypothetical protein
VNQTAEDDEPTIVGAEDSFLGRHPRLRRELFIVLWALATGLIIMPVLVYVVGFLTLGPYASGGWYMLFLDLFKGLWRGWWAAWALILGPLLLVYFIRGIRLVYKRFLCSPELETS